MKKAMLVTLLCLIAFNVGSSFASYIDETGFIENYKITVNNLNSIEAYRAFSKLKSIYRYSQLDKNYKESRIKSVELKKILEELSSSFENPVTAKDYFFKGLLSYVPGEGGPEHPDNKINLRYVIDNFPDTVYAEFAYVFLAEISESKEKVKLLTNYLYIYGEDSKLTLYIYSVFSDAYSYIYMRSKDEESEDDKKKIEFMLNYSNKILNEFSGNKNYAEIALTNLARYHAYNEDYDKALEFFYQLYNDTSNKNNDLYIRPILRLHKERKEYIKMHELLEGLKTRYRNRSDIRKLYKEQKRNLEEIEQFGYDEIGHRTRYRYEKEEVVRTRKKENEQIYKKKKKDILRFREKWNTKFEKEWPETAYEKLLKKQRKKSLL